MTLVKVKEYTDVSAMLADYAARRARFNRAGPDPVSVTPSPPEVKPTVVDAPRVGPLTISDVIERYRRAHPGCALFALRDPTKIDAPSPAAPPEEATLIAPVPSVMEIVRRTAFEFGVSVTDILGTGRTGDIVPARHRVMWLAARDTYNSLAGIGRILGRDHTTVIHGIRAENERTGTNVRGLGGVYNRKVGRRSE